MFPGPPQKAMQRPNSMSLELAHVWVLNINVISHDLPFVTKGGSSYISLPLKAGRFGYWVTTKGGHLTAAEMSRLQGFPDWLIPWRAIGVTDRQYAMMMGNAMTLTVVMGFMPELLYSAGKIGHATYQELARKAKLFLESQITIKGMTK